MSDKDNIEELFRKELGNYKAKVDPGLWSGIQSGLSGASAASSIGVLGKVLIGISTAAAITVGTVLYLNTSDKTDDNKSHPQTIIEDSIVESKPTLLEKNTIEIENSAPIKEEKIAERTEKVAKEHTIDIKKTETTKEKLIIDHGEDLNEENIASESQNTKNTAAKSDLSNRGDKATEPQSSKSNISEENYVVEQQSKEESSNTQNNLLEKVSASIQTQENQYVSLIAENIPENAHISWDFGDGNFDRTQQPEHFYDNAGEYNITLNVKLGAEEIIKTIAVEIKIEGEITDLPNVFTPNGDGRNDVFYINSKHLSSFQLTVIDKNQKKVFSTNDKNFKWNGHDFNGQAVKEGIYYYIIVAEDEAGNVINKYQELHLTR